MAELFKNWHGKADPTAPVKADSKKVVQDTLHTLQDHIEFYSKPHYDPLYQAQHFFTIHSNEDISKNMNAIASIQTDIEHLLSAKVRQHYSSFLKANEGIRHIESEINELSVLVKSTQQLLEVVTHSHRLELLVT
jgi:hypothetical protein